MQLKVENAFVEAGLFVGDAHFLGERDEVGGGYADPDTEQPPQLCLYLHNGADTQHVCPIGGADNAASRDMQRVIVVGNHFFEVVIRHVAAHTDVEILSQWMRIKS